MEVIAIFPAILSVLVCVLRSPSAAFLDVYLPVLLLIPTRFHWVVAGLPDPGFQHAAILPIACLLPFLRHAQWRFSLTDLLVFGYAGVIGYSEYRAAGWKDAQNLIFDQLCVVVLPYVLAKLLIQPEGNESIVARRVSGLLALVAVLSIWEFRMGTRLFFETLWGFFFPFTEQITSEYRWGFGRIAGPYGHAIHAGMMFGIGIFLQAWLMHARQWKTRRSGLVVLGLIVLGSMLTMSRGPWLGILLGGCVVILGFVRDRRGVVLRLCLLAMVIGPPAWQFFDEYVSGASAVGDSAARHSAAYRAELYDVYMPTILNQAEFGYGSHRWPENRAYWSVDNHYMFLALEHGLVAVVMLAGTMLWVCARLAIFAARRPPMDPTGSLAWTLAGAIGSIAVAITTVFLGVQVEPVLFLLLGWSESLLAYGSVRSQAASAKAAVPRLHNFRRVLT